MSLVELIPVNKGNRFALDINTTTTIGRIPSIGCLDNKISRNHAQLFVKSDGTAWIKPIHHNPTFFKTKTDQIVILTKDKEYQLHDNDQFGLLPNEYFFRVSITLKKEEPEKPSESNKIVNSSTIPKSPRLDNKILANDKADEEISERKIETISNKARALPSWISDDSVSTSSHDKQEDRGTTRSIPPVTEQTKTVVKSSKVLVYDDDDDEPMHTASSTAQASTSDNTNLTTDNQTSLTTDKSTKRKPCAYGESCYRKNPAHRQQVSHPGDPDWETEDNNNDKNKSKPECPYGAECYRKNPEHFIEYHHPRKRVIEIKTKKRGRKRTDSEDVDDDEDDDDGLPNEYDYNDSFINDSELYDSVYDNDEEASVKSDGDVEWKPSKNGRGFDDTDDDSSDESDLDLTRKEADEFVNESTAKNKDGPVIKKPRIDDESND